MTATGTDLHSYPEESSFHSAWRTACNVAHGALQDEEVELALAGGALADRLAWVFVSGYQAAVRRCFPELVSGSGWTCLAAAEGRDGPGCVLATDGEDYLLSGEKSWVAGAGVLESLVVSVNEGDSRCFAGVEASAPGVAIDLPRTPGFLGEMTQGVARFDAVRVVNVINEPARGLWFRGAEPLYVMLALNACLKARALVSESVELAARTEEAIELGRTLPAVLDDKAAILAGLDGLRTLTSRALAASNTVVAQSPALAKSWQADAKLFAMFGVAAAGDAA